MIKPKRGSAPQPDHIMISFCGDPHTQLAVTWRTSDDIENGYVEYWCENGEKQVCISENSPFVSDIDSSIIHWAQLKNLKPGTKYSYTCGNENYRSKVYSFETEKEDEHDFTFVALSDFQRGEPHDLPDYSKLNVLLKRVLAEHPEIKFILSAGDSTDCGQHEVQWNGMFSGLTDIIESKPYIMAVGNHDNRGFKDYDNCIGRYYAEPAEYFCNQFRGSYPDNGPEAWKTENYSFDYGDMHMVIFGINGPEDVNDWAIKDLDSSKKIWKMGTYHFPVYYSGVDCENDDAYPVMRESMEKTDIMFSGHEHNFSRSFPIRNEEIFDKPSDGTVHYMLGNSQENPAGSFTLSKVWHAAYYTHCEYKSMFALVRVQGSKVTLTSILDDGRIVDKCVIDKQADTIEPFALAPTYRRPRMLFKGMDPGLAQAAVYPENKDGVWFIAGAVLMSFIGGEVERKKASVTMTAYGHTATFTLGSDIAETENGTIKMEANVYKGMRDQLYIPADAFAKAFGMKWCYAPRNNFLSFETESEDKLVPVQPY